MDGLASDGECVLSCGEVKLGPGRGNGLRITPHSLRIQRTLVRQGRVLQSDDPGLQQGDERGEGRVFGAIIFEQSQKVLSFARGQPVGHVTKRVQQRVAGAG